MEIKEYTDEVEQFIQLEKWSEALIAIEAKQKLAALSKSEIMKLGLIYFNLQQDELSYASFAALSWDNYADCAWLRRMIIAPLIKVKNF